MEPSPIARNPIQEKNDGPDRLLEEATEVLRMGAGDSWWVIIEHTGSERLIEIECDTQEVAVGLLDRIERAFEAGAGRVRIDPLHLISLKGFRQAWVSAPMSE